MKKKNLLKFFCFMSLTGFFLLKTKYATAQELKQFSLSIEPAYQEVTLHGSEESVEQSFTLLNYSTQPQEIELFAFDFKQSDEFGTISLIDGLKENYPHTLASFLSFSVDRFVLEPNTKKEVKFTVNNRDNLSAGGHYAAIIARSSSGELSNQQVLPAVSSLILVRKIEGERINLSLSSSDFDINAVRFTLPKIIDLTFINEGNVHVIPRGTIKVKDIFNRVVLQSTINESSLYVLPGTRRRISNNLSLSRFVWPVMFYTLEIQGNTHIGEVSFSTERSFILIHYSLFFIFAGIVLIIYLAKLRRKRNGK